jgi:hypothetical protein
MTRFATIMDLHDDNTLAGLMAGAFAEEAKRHGLRLEGIEDDANEWQMFFLAVARRVLGAPSPPTEQP